MGRKATASLTGAPQSRAPRIKPARVEPGATGAAPATASLPGSATFAVGDRVRVRFGPWGNARGLVLDVTEGTIGVRLHIERRAVVRFMASELLREGGAQ